jgi:hypothetical protein
MAVKPDLADKFGLDWLGPSNRAASVPSNAPNIPADVPRAKTPADAAHIIIGKQILGVLKNSPDKTDAVYGLVDRLQIDIQTVLSAVDYLERTGFITVTKDNYGNHKLKLTDAGEAWLS